MEAPSSTVHDAGQSPRQHAGEASWPGRDVKVADYLPGSVYLWACGEPGEEGGPTPEVTDAVAAWIVLLTQAVLYSGLWYVGGNRYDPDDAGSSPEYSIFAVAGSMYLMLSIPAADLCGGCALVLEQKGWTWRRAFGVCLVGTFLLLVGASIRVLFYSSIENVELVLGSAAVLFIADVDEKVMVVLKNFSGQWRLFWVTEMVGLSFVLALFSDASDWRTQGKGLARQFSVSLLDQDIAVSRRGSSVPVVQAEVAHKGIPLLELSRQQGATRRRGVSMSYFSLSVRAGGGSSESRTASALSQMRFRLGGAAAAPAKYPRKRQRVEAPWCPSPVLLAAALVCLTTATASALPGASAPSRAAVSVGDGDRRRVSWRDPSRKSGGAVVGGGGFFHPGGKQVRQRQDQRHPSRTPLVQESSFVQSLRRGVNPAEALRVRGGGRPLFTGYEDTTEGEGSSSEESETTGYDGSSTEAAESESESEGGHTTDSESSGWQQQKGQSVEDGGRKGDKGDGEEGEDEGSGMSPASRALAEDLYARTFARRMALALTCRVIQRALMRTAFLLVAFQVSPWLRHNFIAQLVLVGSLVLQTATEIVAVARAVETSGTQGKGDPGRESSGAKGPGKNGSSPSIPPPLSAPLIGGIMKVFSPDNQHGQHFDFVRLNDIFDKDVEALAAALQSKLDVPSLLATGAAEGSGFPMAGRMMKAFKGLAGGNNEGDGLSEAKNEKDLRRKVAAYRKAWSKESSKQSGKRAVAKDDEPERSEKRGGVGDNMRVHGADTDGDRKDHGRAPLAEGASSDTEGGVRKPSSEGGRLAVNVENFSVENMRHENKGGTERTGASPAGEGNADGTGAGGDGSVRAPVAAAQDNTAASDQPPKRVFVMSFRPGHGPEEKEEQQMDLLSATIAFLIANGNPATDEVVVLLESGGGEVSAFGLAATKLASLRGKGFRLTVCVDKVAASGGYLMACVADKLVVASFATLGSIGVVGAMPNFNKVLRKNGVEYYHFTAGQHKSLVGPFQEVTKANLAAQQKQMDDIHYAFKQHVQRYRPSVDVEAVGTGEVWLGHRAVKLGLADEVGTAAEYLQSRMANAQVLMVKQHKKVIGHGPSLLRAILLGPLRAASNASSSVSAFARVIKLLRDITAGGVYGAPSQPVTGGGDSLTRPLLTYKDYARVAGLDGSGLHGAGTGTPNGGSWGIPPLEGAGYVPVFRGVEWENGSGADLPGRSRRSHEAAVGEEMGGFWF
eukprot:g10195.t1